MIHECFRTKTSIRCLKNRLKDIGLDPATLWPQAHSQTGPRMAQNSPISMVPSGEHVKLHPQATPSPTAPTLLSPQSGKHTRDISASTTRTLVGTRAGGVKGPLHPGALEMPVDEEQQEARDAVCQVYDQLSRKPWWWIVEFLPIEQRKRWM